MRTIQKLLAVCLAAMLLALTTMPALATDSQTCLVEFYWDKAGDDADNGYKAYEIAYGSFLKAPDDPERYGCTFLGWKDWNTEQLVDLTTLVANAPVLRFYAAWQQTTYTSRFYVFGELWTSVENVAGEPFIQPRLPMVDGYTFTGWDPKTPEIAPAEDLQFNAVFEKNTFTSTFYVFGELWTSVENVAGEAFIQPRLPTVDGYTFTGWSPKPPQTAPAQALSFNAVFEAITSVATLVVDDEVYMEIPYTYGQKSIDLPDVPKKDGYTGAWEPYALVIGGVTIHAIYTPKKYIAQLIVDGEVYRKIAYTYGQKSIALPEVPKKEGYTGMWGPYSLVVGGTKIEAIYSPIDNTAKTVNGDADGNGGVDLRDVVLLTRTLAGGWDSRVCTANMDVNGDGLINLKDVTLIRRYLAGGWDVTL